MNTAIQDSFDLGWKLAWVLRGWASAKLLASYEVERRPIAAHNVQRAGEPTGARRDSDQALPWDLNGRVAHHWLSTCEQQTSTIDLIGDGFTILAGPSDPHWARFAGFIPARAPIHVHNVDAATADALDLPPTGGLVTRPDGRELRRWIDADAATTEGFDWATPGGFLELVASPGHRTPAGKMMATATAQDENPGVGVW